MQLTLSCSLITFLDLPLDTSLLPIIRVTENILAIPSISSDANICGVAAPEKLKIPVCQCDWIRVSTRIRLSPISGELHPPIFMAVYSIEPKPRHGNNPFSPVAPRSNSCDHHIPDRLLPPSRGSLHSSWTFTVSQLQPLVSFLETRRAPAHLTARG